MGGVVRRIKELLKGLEILDKMMAGPRWGISEDGSIIVSDKYDDEDEIIQPRIIAKLSELGWIFDEVQGGWIIQGKEEND